LDVVGSLQPREVIARILERGLHALHADRATLSSLVDQHVVIEATYGRAGALTWVGQRYSLDYFAGQPLVKKAIETLKPTFGGRVEGGGGCGRGRGRPGAPRPGAGASAATGRRVRRCGWRLGRPTRRIDDGARIHHQRRRGWYPLGPHAEGAGRRQKRQSRPALGQRIYGRPGRPGNHRPAIPPLPGGAAGHWGRDDRLARSGSSPGRALRSGGAAIAAAAFHPGRPAVA